MLCLSCDRENPETARFCNSCGSELAATCPKCGQTNPPGSAFCNACGNSLAAAEAGTDSPGAPSAAPFEPQPTSFADGRYQVQKFLGEGGKKRVYLAHDGVLDRDVALAVIKTEGLDETSRA